ncbi:replication initiation protein [Pediococcus pentosaceus]|uniref:replication initiation protein n=1 Tax=Pediococcus pentosaceus TaxID=1255 RepID=UPI0021E95EA5|nr:replication initiation protein [Pediococcus pentosaceus]MCV3320542.1 replication initiation protein [Pediococcus pentosaceus]
MSDRIDVETNELTKNLLKRQDYLVTQGNDLAKAFGNLRALEHKILDYCFSFVAKDSKLDDVFELRILDIVKHLGLNSSGRNYTRVAQGFKVLNESTPLYFLSEDGGIIMTNLFEYYDR